MESLAIINIHPNIKSWNKGTDPRDAAGNPVVLDKSAIATEVIRLQAEFDANQYQRDRQYPSIGDQLDLLFHDMTEGKGSKTGEWYKEIAKVKSNNPKPE